MADLVSQFNLMPAKSEQFALNSHASSQNAAINPENSSSNGVTNGSAGTYHHRNSSTSSSIHSGLNTAANINPLASAGSGDVSRRSDSPESESSASRKQDSPSMEELQKAAGAPGIVGSEPIPTKSLLIKTKKPRPYVCTTCTRSFVRLEHLKRHERSHTKEKPFQCPICERSFARRDLLLRHKQKLHASFSPNDKSEENARMQQQQHQSSPALQNQHSQQGHEEGQGSINQDFQRPPDGFAGQDFSVRDFPEFQTPQDFQSSQEFQASQDLQAHDLQPVSSASSSNQPLNNPVGLSSIPMQSMSPNNDFVPFPMKGSNDYAVDQWSQNGPVDGFDQYFNDYNSQWTPSEQVPTQNTMMAPPVRMSARSSRASSFSAVSATSYVRNKDLMQAHQIKDSIEEGASEVGFATPQAYAVDDDGGEFEELDLNYVDPHQLTQLQPPPRKRRASVRNGEQPNISASEPGGALQALRNQVYKQRQLYSQFGGVSSTADNNRVRRKSMRGEHQAPPQVGTPNYQSPQYFTPPEQPQSHHAQQPHRSQPLHHHRPTIPPTPHHNIPTIIPTNDNDMGYIPSGNPEIEQDFSHNNTFNQNQSSPTKSIHGPRSYNQHTYTENNVLNPQPQRFSRSRGSSFIDSVMTPQEFNASFIKQQGSPPNAYGMTPDMTPGMTPGMGVPYHSSMAYSKAEEMEMQDYLAKQNEDFVNSLFDVDVDTSRKSKEQDPLEINEPVIANENTSHVTGAAGLSVDLTNNFAPNNYTGSNDFTNFNGILGGNNELPEFTKEFKYQSLSPMGEINFDSIDSVAENLRAGSISAEADSDANGDLQRFVDAYFSGFDPHLPFIHRSGLPFGTSMSSSGHDSPGFSPPSSTNSVVIGPNGESVSMSSVILAQAQAAIGAQTLGERGAAQAYYWTARDHKGDEQTSAVELFQADLLVAIWGIFSDEPSEHTIAFTKLEGLANRAEEVLLKSHSVSGDANTNFYSSPNKDIYLDENRVSSDIDLIAGAERIWRHFTHKQTKVRTLYALYAVCTWIRQVPDHLLDLLKRCDATPCDDDLWRASNSDKWLRIVASRGMDANTVADYGGSEPYLLSRALDCLLAGKLPKEKISPSTLQTLLLILQEFTTRANLSASRVALRTWETLWSRFPEASLNPSPISGPIMSDCVGIVSLTAFGYLDLKPMLDALWKQDFEGVGASVQLEFHNEPGNFSAANYAVDTLVWCEGHVSSQSIFFTTILAVAECGLILANVLKSIGAKKGPLSANEEQLVQRSQKLVRNVLRVQPTDNVSELPGSVLKSAACLVRLSDWPLVSVLSRSLLAHKA